MFHSKAFSLALVGGLGLAMAGQVRAVTLADNATLTGTGVTFSNFRYYSAATSASDVNVALTPDGTGVIFTSNWSTDINPHLDAVIEYDITSTSGNLTGSSLTISGNAATGGSAVEVAEGFFNANGTPRSEGLDVYSTGTGSQTSTVSFGDPATTTITAVKDISVTRGPGEGAHAAVSFVDNTFTTTGNGTPPPVPEPMTLALIPMGLVGLGLRKKLAR